MYELSRLSSNPSVLISLVTFAGFVASHVIDQLLELGYKVRGAARSQVKLEKYQKRWDSKYPGQFEFVEVPDILKNGAYDEAIKGELPIVLEYRFHGADPLDR